MSEYYRGELRGASSHDIATQKSLLLAVVDWAMGLVSLMVLLATFLTFIAPYVEPKGWLFPVLALIAPATFVLLFSLMLFWVVRWNWIWSAVMGLFVIISLFYIDLFLRVEIRRNEPVRPRRGVVTLIDYNIRMFYGPDGESNRDSLFRLVKSYRPDIVCFQEFTPETGGGSREIVDALMGESYYSTEYEEFTGNVIYSKYPIIESGLTREDMEGVRSIWADVVIAKRDTIRIYNHHLHSTAINSEDDLFLSRDNFIQDTAREEKLFSIVDRYRDNAIERASQADSLAQAQAQCPYRMIVCGDFNDTPMSYTVNTLSDDLTDAFCEVGRGYGYTFRGFSNTLRIDYVLLSEGWEVLYYTNPKVDLSDHLPIVTSLKLKK